MLIDATMNLDYDPDPDFGGARFPPLIWPSDEDRKAAHARWKELGLDAARSEGEALDETGSDPRV